MRNVPLSAILKRSSYQLKRNCAEGDVFVYRTQCVAYGHILSKCKDRVSLCHTKAPESTKRLLTLKKRATFMRTGPICKSNVLKSIMSEKKAAPYTTSVRKATSAFMKVNDQHLSTHLDRRRSPLCA